jgi:hypothetical protein
VKVDVAGTVAGSFGWFGTVSPYNPGPDNKTVPAAVAGWTEYQAQQLMDSAVNDGYHDAQVNIGAGATYQFDDFVTQQITSVSDWSLF